MPSAGVFSLSILLVQPLLRALVQLWGCAAAQVGLGSQVRIRRLCGLRARAPFSDIEFGSSSSSSNSSSSSRRTGSGSGGGGRSRSRSSISTAGTVPFHISVGTLLVVAHCYTSEKFVLERPSVVVRT